MADNKITVTDFVNKYTSLATEEARGAYIDSVIKTRYIDWEEKDYWAKTVVKGSCYKPGSDTNDLANVEINRNRERFLTRLVYVQAYTNIVFTSSNSGTETLDEYNLLEEYELIDKITARLPEHEFGVFNEAIENALQDFKDSIMRPQAYIDEIVERLRGGISSLGDGLKDVAPSLMKIVENLNSEDLDKVLKLIGDLFKS